MFRDRAPITTYWSAPHVGIGHNGGGSASSQNQSIDKYQYEWIEDGSGGNQEENPCSHFFVQRAIDKAIPLRYSSSMNHNGSGPWTDWTAYDKGSVFGLTSYSPYATYDLRYGTYDNPYTGLPSLTRLDGPKLVIVQPAEISTLIDDSLNTMLPGIRPKLSILNSLYELKDLKTLPKSLANIRRWRIAFDEFNRTLNRHTIRTLLRSTVRSASDIYLQNAFNVQPILSDMKGVISSLQSVKRQVNSLLANEGKVQKRHFRRFLNRSYVNTHEEFSYANSPWTGDGTSTIQRDVAYLDPTFCATLTYSYELSGLERENALLNGYLDSMGVFTNPRIIWAAIPWSFVVDWFVGIGRFLQDNFSMRNIEPKTHIISYTYSFKVRRSVTTRMSMTGSTYGPSCVGVPICSGYEEAYIRVPHKPDIYRSLRVSGLDPEEFRLSTALLGTFIRVPH